MRATRLTTYAITAITVLGLSRHVRAEDSTGGKFYFPVGFAYASGIHKATDKLFDYYEQDGFDVNRIDIPIGLV